MTTATLTDREPSHPALRFHDGCSFDDPKTGDDFYRKVFAFEKKNTTIVDAMNDRLLKLLQGPLSVFLTERENVRRDWQIDTGSQGKAFVALRWEIFDIRLGLTAAHNEQVRLMRQVFDDARQDEMDSLKAIGVHNAMPAAGVNPAAAERQLAHEVEKHPVVASAKGDWMVAREALRVLESQQESVPTRDSCKLEWPVFAPEGAEVATMIGLDRVTHQAESALSEFGRRICRDFGLANAPLLPSHVAAFEGLAVFGKETFHPLMSLAMKDLSAIAELVGQLPRTKEVRRFLADARNGRNPFAHTI